MPCHLFKRYIPDPESIRSQKSLCFLGRLTHDPNLWYLNRHPVLRAMAAGLFAAFIPMPMQILLAAGLAVWIRNNLPISVGSVQLANLTTMPPVLYCTYRLGAWLMQVPPCILSDYLTWEWISQEPSNLRQPLLPSSVACGIVAVILGYALTMFYWHWWVQHSWSQRCRRRHERVAAK